MLPLEMGRKRRQSRRGGKKGGGALSSLRGGIRSMGRGAMGIGPARPTTPARRMLGNVVTALLILAAAALLARRFGVWGR